MSIKYIHRLIINFMLIQVFLITTLLIYNYQIQPNNSYSGMKEVTWNQYSTLYCIISCIICTLLISRKIRTPSDIFIIIYTIFSLLYTSYFSNITKLAYNNYMLFYLFLYIPPILIAILKKKIAHELRKIKLYYPILPRNTLFLISILFSIITICNLIIEIPVGSLSLDSMYQRRLLARDYLGKDLLFPYILNITTNGLIPLLAFYSIIYKNKKCFIASLLFPFITFWFIGLKSPFLYVIAMMIFAAYMKKNKIENMALLIIKLLVFISLTSLIESFIFEYSYLADYFIRRLIFVASLIQNYYLNEISIPDNFLYGKRLTNSDVTFYIGEKYFQNQSTNANTNTFLYYFLKYGLIGYMINLICIFIIFIYLDLLWLKTKNVEIIATSILYSFLLIEQSFTTALISSGILLLIIILSITKKSDNIYSRR